MDINYRFVWKKKNELGQTDKDAIHDLAMSFYPEGREAYNKNYWYSSIEPDALLLVYDKEKIVAYSKYVVNVITIQGARKTLAGFSLLTHGDYQQRGIAGAIVDELKKSMPELKTDILYATTIFPHVAHILQKRDFIQLKNKVSYQDQTTEKTKAENEPVFLYVPDSTLLKKIQNEKIFFIGRGPM